MERVILPRSKSTWLSLEKHFSCADLLNQTKGFIKANKLPNLSRSHGQQCQRFSGWDQSLKWHWQLTQTSDSLLPAQHLTYWGATHFQILVLIITIWDMHESSLYANFKNNLQKLLVNAPSFSGLHKSHQKTRFKMMLSFLTWAFTLTD